MKTGNKLKELKAAHHAAWDNYIATRLEKLKTAAWDAAITEEVAENSRDLAWRVCKAKSNNGITPTDSDWEAYRAADEVFMDARAASQRAEFAYVSYKRYLDGLKSTDNTVDADEAED